jgi:hypothetical protein
MNRVKATSFADPQDLRAYNHSIRQGKSPRESLSVGDNGVGAWEMSTAAGTGACCALARDTEGFRHGRLVRVFYGERSVDCELRDVAPEGVIDLNPDACEALGLKPPVSVMVDWVWL